MRMNLSVFNNLITFEGDLFGMLEKY